MNNEEQEIVKAFLLDLKALMVKYGASLSGCGCCGSPFVSIEKHVRIDGVSVDANEASHKHYDQTTQQWVKVTF